ncbi:MAG: DUF669 domain-containing protein [Smithella sp.]|jgi:alpha-glucosidase (family GH31 glycosyl hydrolase)
MKYNMTGVEEGGNFELLPEGVYVVKIKNTEDEMSRAGDPMVAVTFEIIEGDKAGQFAWDRILFPKKGSSAEKIRGRSMHFLHVIGEPYEGEIEIDRYNWVGKKCKIFVRHEEYEGKRYARVQGHDFIEHGKEQENKEEIIPF